MANVTNAAVRSSRGAFWRSTFTATWRASGQAREPEASGLNCAHAQLFRRWDRSADVSSWSFAFTKTLDSINAAAVCAKCGKQLALLLLSWQQGERSVLPRRDCAECLLATVLSLRMSPGRSAAYPALPNVTLMRK
jgi:hypothetical protein